MKAVNLHDWHHPRWWVTYILVVLVLTAVAAMVGVWITNSVSQTVESQAHATAFKDATEVSSELTRSTAALIDRVDFVGDLAFRSPGVSGAALGEVLRQFIHSNKGFGGITLIDAHDAPFWSYGRIGSVRGLASVPIAGLHQVMVSPFRLEGTRLVAVALDRVVGFHGQVLGSVVAQVGFLNPIPKGLSGPFYLTHPGEPSIVLQNSSTPHFGRLSSLGDRAEVDMVTPRNVLVAGIGHQVLTGQVHRALEDPLLVLGVIWLVLVGMGLAGVARMALADKRQEASRRRATLAELSKRLTEAAFGNWDLSELFAEFCQVIDQAVEAAGVWVVFGTDDGERSLIGPHGGLVHEPVELDLKLMGLEKPPGEVRSWIRSRSAIDETDTLVWRFGGRGRASGAIVVARCVAGADQLLALDLGVLDVAVDRSWILAQRDLMTAAVAAVDAGVAVFRGDGQLRWANLAWRGLLGLSTDPRATSESPTGTSLEYSLLELCADDGNRIAAFLAGSQIDPAQHFEDEVSCCARSGRVFWGLLTLSRVSKTGGGVVIGDIVALLRDTSQSHEVAALLTHQVEHDALTGTLSRTALETGVTRMIEDRVGQPFGFAILDIDGFKLVNDTWGHAVGDTLLVGIGERLMRMVGSDHLVARLGGDEFVVVAPLDTQPLSCVVSRIEQIIGDPFDVDAGLSIAVRASMGIAQFPDDAESLDSLLREADRALYQAKANKAQRSRWWLTRAELEVSAILEQDPWSPRVQECFDVNAAVLDQVLIVVTDMLRYRMQGDRPACVSARGHDWVDAHREVLSWVVRGSPDLQRLGREIEMRGAEMEVSGGDRSLVELTESLVTSAFLDDSIGPSIATKERRTLVDFTKARVRWAIERERDGMAAVRANYLASAAGQSYDSECSWESFVAATLDRVAFLPGVRLAMFIGADAGESSEPTYLGGSIAPEFREWLASSVEARAIIDPTTPIGPGDGSDAWENNHIVYIDDVLASAGYQRWQNLMIDWDVRSALIIPIMVGMDALGLVVVFGTYAHQFNSDTPSEFATSLQRSLRAGWLHFDPERSESLTSEVAQGYRRAITHGGLVTYVQPILDLRIGQITRVEFLARLDIGDGRIISPAEFLLALGSRELSQLFTDSLEVALGLQDEWAAAGMAVDCSLNLAASTLLDPRFTDAIEAARRRRHADLRGIVLELLEGEHLSDGAAAMIRDLVGHGIGFAIDDLGSGYSNLDRLVDLPFREVKLDRSLVQRLLTQPRPALGIIGGLLQAAHDAGRVVVFEGIERVELLEVATALGADYAQGYAIARPMPSAEFLNWLTSFRSAGWQPDEWSGPVAPTVNSVIGAIAALWRETRTRSETLSDDWRDCSVSDFLARTFGQSSHLVHLHRRLHLEGLIPGFAYDQLISELDQYQRLVPGDHEGLLSGGRNYHDDPISD